MSFSSQVKAELCRATTDRRCCALAECCGILYYCNTVAPQLIKIVTESEDFAARLPRLFQRAFSVRFDSLPTGRGKHVFLLTDPAKIEAVFHAIGYAPSDSITLHINYALLENDCCRKAFLRGAFLAGGSVTDPEKRYHLELVTSHFKVSRECCKLLMELGFSPKETMRGGSSVLYFKKNSAIEDVLTLFGAPVSAMAVMEAKVEKGMKNKINRIVNCDSANLIKIVDAAQAQIAAIRKLEEHDVLKTLSVPLRQTARLRLENPEANLEELAALSDPPVSKSAVNHRLRKLQELAREQAPAEAQELTKE